MTAKQSPPSEMHLMRYDREGLEARCARLEEAIRNHLKLCTEDTWQAMEAAVSDTAQEDTGDA